MAPQFELSRTQQEAVNACWFRVGEEVLVHDVEAVVRYIGPIRTRHRHSRGIYVGIELGTPAGKTDGSIDGTVYFSCPPRHGLFVRPRLVERRRVIKESTTGHDFSKLKGLEQTVSLAPDERETFRYWNVLDRLEESAALSTSKEIDLVDHEMNRQLSEEELTWHSLLDPQRSFSPCLSESSQSSGLLTPASTDTGRRQSIFSRRLSCVTVSSVLEEQIDSSYIGPHLKGVPDFAFANQLVELYRETIVDKLHSKYVMQILMQIEEFLTRTQEGAVLHFSIPKKPDTQLIVVGDVHGQLNDVLWLFYKFGTPSPTRTFLFNGDIADRGRNAVEIFLILFAFQLADPNCVIINRGNHESADMNEIYGFAQEVRSKYGVLIYQKFQDVFNLLPLCVVVEKRVLVLHGGLFRQDGVTLDDINKLNRKRPCPSFPETDEDKLMFDLLWSDPRHDPGRGPSGRGADCVAFGPDITEKFLADNGLDVCVRSHQVPTTLRGFEPVHEGRCVTLFSASNYCGTSGNYGGVIIFDPRLTFEIQEYMAPAMSEVREVFNETKIATAKVASATTQQIVKIAEHKAQQRNRRASVANMERDVIHKMTRIICENKDALWNAFWDSDTTKEGLLPTVIWNACLDKVVGAQHIPWTLILKKLDLETANGLIAYEDFLKKFRVEFRPKHAKHANWRFETVQQVFESIMKADLNLKETLMVFDRNCDGTVSYREFHELLTELNFGLSEPQVRLLMRIITAHYLTREVPGQSRGDPVGRIDVAEFLGRFKVIYGLSIKDRDSAADPWISKTIEAVGRAILADKAEAANRHYLNSDAPPDGELGGGRRRSSALRSAALFQKFKDFGAVDNEPGFLSYKRFIKAIRQLPLPAIEAELKFSLDDDRLIRLARAIDVTGSGKINYLEFLNAFHVVDENATTNVAEEVWQQICASFFQQSIALRRALSHLDPDGTGKVDPEEFRGALMTLNMVLGPREAPLTAEQIDLVVNSIDAENDGFIDYDAFLDSFVVVDVVPETAFKTPEPPNMSLFDSQMEAASSTSSSDNEPMADTPQLARSVGSSMVASAEDLVRDVGDLSSPRELTQELSGAGQGSFSVSFDFPLMSDSPSEGHQFR